MALAAHAAGIPAPRTLRLRDGRSVRVRPIAPADAEPLRMFDGALCEASHQFRYLGWMPRLTPEQAVAMATVDFEHRFALVATAGHESEGEEEVVVADCRMDAEAGLPAEFAIAVADDHRCVGLGPPLIRQLLDIAADRGIEVVEAQVRSDNRHMLHVLRRLGFEQSASELGILTLTASMPSRPGPSVGRRLSA